MVCHQPSNTNWLIHHGIPKPFSFSVETMMLPILKYMSGNKWPAANCHVNHGGLPRYQTALLGALASMENTMNSQGRVMGASACADLEYAYFTYRSALNWLARQSLQANKCRYRLRPKVHQAAHIACCYQPLNPRRFANYLDEDFIFKTKKVAEKAHPLFMPMHTAMRYSIAVCLRWWQGSFWTRKSKKKFIELHAALSSDDFERGTTAYSKHDLTQRISFFVVSS